MNTRRLQILQASAGLPIDPLDRAHALCRALEDVGVSGAFAASLRCGDIDKRLVAAFGDHPSPRDPRVRYLCEQLHVHGRALEIDRAMSMDPIGTHLAAIPCGHLGDEMMASIVIADSNLSHFDLEVIATAASNAAWVGSEPELTRFGWLSHELAAQHQSDLVSIALFSKVGITVRSYVRSGALLRCDHLPEETIWGDAGRHGAAYVLGDLELHQGTEGFSLLGMASAAIVGIDNGAGMPLGSIAVLSADKLDVQVASSLLDRGVIVGRELMERASDTRVPQTDASGNVDICAFAGRVGCERFALYTRTGNVVRLLSAHDQFGGQRSSDPDPHEAQMVQWAAEREVALVSDDAAVIAMPDGNVLYARDRSRDAMASLKLALQDVRRNPYGQADAA